MSIPFCNIFSNTAAALATMRETKVWFTILFMVVASSVFANNANATPKNNLLKQSTMNKISAAQKAAFGLSKGQILKKYQNVKKRILKM